MFKKLIRLNQASTWKGLLSLLMAFGLFTFSDTQLDAIAAAAAAVYMALSVILPDKLDVEDERPKDGQAE